MIDVARKAGPLVSIITCTYTHRQYLPEALRSAIRQSYPNIEVIVVNDGGEDVSDIVDSFNDPRIRLFQRKENRGYSPSLNEGIGHARGKYICYLDDDDRYYPNHVQVLVDALEGPTDCQVAYSDLYKVFCRVEPDGRRRVLSKIVAVSRDFDRVFEMHYNMALHVSVMHRRDLLDKTGLYNENVRVLSDWDVNRRFAFYTDFLHLTDVTGEFYVPMNQFDRMSYKMRKDQEKFFKHFMTIRTTRPPKPWPKMPDLSIVFAPDYFDRSAVNALRDIWRHTFMPYQMYLAMPGYSLSKVRTEMPNLVGVPVGPNSTFDERVDVALRRCEGDYVAVVPHGLAIREMWVEPGEVALMGSSRPKEGVLLMEAGGQYWGAVFRTDELLEARRRHPDMTVKQSVEADGFFVRQPAPDELPFQFDNILKNAERMEEDSNWELAAKMYLQNCRTLGNDLWMKAKAARAMHQAGGRGQQVFELCRELNERRPTVDTLYLEAMHHRRAGRLDEAIGLLEHCKGILDGEQTP